MEKIIVKNNMINTQKEREQITQFFVVYVYNQQKKAKHCEPTYVNAKYCFARSILTPVMETKSETKNA